MVAPNGAYKRKSDHAAVPLTADELATVAKQCLDDGAAAIHLHVRDAQGRHLLDAEAYRTATAAIRAAVGDDLVIQITTESGKIYPPPAQMQVVRDVHPEAVSVSIAELLPVDGDERVVAEFFQWLAQEHIMMQVILYSADDVRRYRDLKLRGVIPEFRHAVLYVLGRYSAGQTSSPRDLLPFLAANASPASEHDETATPWAMCAFGAREYACAMTAAALGGHVRVGFENNLMLADGSIASNNAALVQQAALGIRGLGLQLANANEARALF
jgi:uncharacterized protein (DUF849 family)